MPREKSPAIPGIDPVTFLLVAQCLNLYATPGPSIILRTINFSDKLQRKSKHTFYPQQHSPENRAVYEIMWKNIVERGRLQMTI